MYERIQCTYCAVSMATGHVVPDEDGRCSPGSVTVQYNALGLPVQQAAIFPQSECLQQSLRINFLLQTLTCIHNVR